MSRTWLFRATLLVVCSAALPACGQLPQPFAPDAAKPNALLELKENRGVAVQDITGVPSVVAARLRSAVAEALRGAEIPAVVGDGNHGSFILRGAAALYPLTDVEDELAIQWQLVDPATKQASESEQREPVPRGQASGPSDLYLSTIAKRAVEGFLPQLRTPMPQDRIAAAVGGEGTGGIPSGPSVAIFGIEQAPGDGKIALRNALDYVLKQNGVRLAAPGQAADMTVVGRVDLPQPSGQALGAEQAVSIRWTVFLADGTELGTVVQENTVPRGSLDKAWGETAVYAAEGAFEGLMALFERFQPPRAEPKKP